MYGKYFNAVPLKRGPVLEIDFGCRMGYGPGVSAKLWGDMGFRDVHFIEYSADCLESVNATKVTNSDLRFQSSVNGNGPDRSHLPSNISPMYRYTIPGSQLQVSVHAGDQSDMLLLEAVKHRALWLKKISPRGFEFIIDDGGHENRQLLASFFSLWPTVTSSGFYVLEDIAGAAYGFYDAPIIDGEGMEQPGSMQYHVAELLQGLFGFSEDAGIGLIECHYSICLLKKQ